MRLQWPLINIALLFILPLGAASYMLSRGSANIHTTQYGTFLQPPMQLHIKHFEQLAGSVLEHKWIILYVQPEYCATTCQQTKKTLLNLHKALGAQSSRVTLIATTGNELIPNIQSDNVLIIDPHGFYIMNYNDIINFGGILKDLRRLLKYSHA